MRTENISSSAPVDFTDDDVREYAYHLYEQSGCVPGHDLDHWLEAKACLGANIPRHQSHRRLHEHLKNGRRTKTSGRLQAVA